MSVVTIHKAETNLSRLIKKASPGEEVLIARSDKSFNLYLQSPKPSLLTSSFSGKARNFG